MAEFPALPLFTDAIIADCAHLTDEEFGRYVRLLMLIWRSPDCRIPHNSEWVSRKMARPYSVLEPLITEFCYVDVNWITHQRLQKELSYLREKSKKQSARAKMRNYNKNGSCCGNAAPHASGNAPTPTPTPITSTNVEGVPPSIEDLLFGPALQYLIKNTGKPESECRSMIGKWRKQFGPDETLEALRKSQNAKAAQPVEYIARLLKPKERYKEKKSNVRTLK